jgi:dTDP-4-dehydrorhamnose reductase
LPKVLITGARGQLGWELQRTFAPTGEVLALDRRDLDLADGARLRRAVREASPDLILNAAAYTGVDAAEAAPAVAMAVNGVAPGILAEEARGLGAALVHFSTDYVFDGERDGPYAEADAPNPRSVYGRTKLAGERAVQDAGGAYLILRTSWVYAARGRNFPLTILRLAGERDELRVVDDQTGAPTWSRLIAEATAQIVAFCRGRRRDASDLFGDARGVYHLTAEGATTWCGFAEEILRHGPSLGLARVPRLVPIRTDEYPTAARRPANSVLSNDRVRGAFGIRMLDWRRAFALWVDDMRLGPGR